MSIVNKNVINSYTVYLLMINWQVSPCRLCCVYVSTSAQEIEYDVILVFIVKNIIIRNLSIILN